MKSSKVLNNLLSEIILLANKNTVIASNIIVLSNNFKNEFSNWLNKSTTQKELLNVPNLSVLESIKWLDKIRQKNPTSMSRPIVFQELINDPDGLKYTPYLYHMDKFFKSSGSQILEQYSDILDATENFKDIQPLDISSIESSLSFIESIYHQYLQKFINQPFSDDKGKTTKPPKITKNEKIKQLFEFLVSEINNQLATSIESYGFDSIASKIRSNPMFIVDHEAISETKLITLKRNYFHMINQAQDLAKIILTKLDSADYEYNYNLLINTAMKFNMVLPDKEYDQYFYKLLMQKSKGMEVNIERINFQNKDWLNQNVISFLFFTLTLIMKKIKF
jgi:hypothetical protein